MQLSTSPSIVLSQSHMVNDLGERVQKTVYRWDVRVSLPDGRTIIQPQWRVRYVAQTANGGTRILSQWMDRIAQTTPMGTVWVWALTASPQGAGVLAPMHQEAIGRRTVTGEVVMGTQSNSGVIVNPTPTAAPFAPSNLRVEDTGGGVIRLQWNDNSMDEGGFEIERRPAFDSTPSVRVGTNTVEWGETVPGMRYEYRVQAFNSVGESEFSPWVEVDVNGGWTRLTPSVDTRTVYVSASEGNDANNGLTPQTPVRTLSAAERKLRDGYPDWMLLKRGDVWTGVSFPNWNKSGRSSAEPLVVSSYGSSSERPKILTPPTATAFQAPGTNVRQHVAFVGLHFEPHARQSTQNPKGIRWIGSCNNILFEDCAIIGYSDNMVFQEFSGSVLRDVRVRRSVIADAWSTAGHSQGLFAHVVDGLLVEECVFDQNGWNTAMGASPSTYNHGIYSTTKNKNVVIRGNVFARSSANGVQARSGGIIEDNVFAENPAGLNFGWAQGGSPQSPEGVTGLVVNNAFVNVIDRGFGGWAIAIGNIGAAGPTTIADNLVLSTTESDLPGMVIAGTNGYGIHNLRVERNAIRGWSSMMRILGTPGVDLNNVEITDNVLQASSGSSILVQFRDSRVGSMVDFERNTYYRPGTASSWLEDADGRYSVSTWRPRADEPSAEQRQVAFRDSSRTIGSYNALQGGPATLEGYLAEARKQSRGRWRSAYTGRNLSRYLREGFLEGQ